MTPTPTPERPGGLLLAERYQLGEPLGGGGSSLVFRGVDQRTKATVVLKLLEPGYAEDEPIVAHFDQEARLAARVRDPHLLGALDFGNDAGCRFIVYEHLPELRSIRVLIDGRERVGPERAAQIALQVLSALDTLHHAGIVHRDVSPGNCLWRMRDDQDEVVLADLGCAGVMPPRPPVTGGPKPTRELYGTAYYTAPEILAGEPHDHRADLWSVGALMYALLTSRDADVGGPGEWLAVKPPAQLVRSVPLALNAVVMKALAPQDQRYQSAAEMMKALRAAMRPQPSLPSSPWRGLGIGGFAGAATTAMLVLVMTPAASSAPGLDECVHEASAASSKFENAGREQMLSPELEDTSTSASVHVPEVEEQSAPATPTPNTSAPVTEDKDDHDHAVAPPEGVAAPRVQGGGGSARRPGDSTLAAQTPSKPQRRGTANPPAPGRGATTNDEAQQVAEAEPVLAALRECAKVPGTIIAEMEIEGGHGTVAKLNRHSPGSAVSWHTCARTALEGLEYPASTIPGRVRVRLQLH